MYLSVYLDQKIVSEPQILLFSVSDKFIFFDSYLQEEEKCHFL